MFVVYVSKETFYNVKMSLGVRRREASLSPAGEFQHATIVRNYTMLENDDNMCYILA